MQLNNPFIYDDPILPKDMINRDQEADKLFSLAYGGHNTRLAAPRRYGKTSLGTRVLERAVQEDLHAVSVDFYRCLTSNEAARRIEEAYLKQLAGPARQAISAITRKWQLKLKAGASGAGIEAEYYRELNNSRLSEFLDLPVSLFKKSGGKRTVILFDEFQDFLRIGEGIDGLVRSKIQLHREEASYIFAGSEPGMMEQLFASKDQPLYDQARPIYLDPLQDTDIAEYIGKRFEQSNRDPGAALDILLDIGRGHPQRVMLLAHHLWEQTAPGTVADEETMQAVLKQVDRETKERFERTWFDISSSPDQRKALMAIANNKTTLYNKATLMEYDMHKGNTNRALQELADNGDVAKIDNQWVIIDPLFERWLSVDNNS